jgi:hypothetical protein
MSAPARIAFLLMVHDNPQQLARLVDALDHPDASFHVHVDAKAPLEPFEAALDGQPKVRLLRNRVVANWMGYSLVEATLRLLADAAEQGFDYCILLSGSDYPIKSVPELFDFYGRAGEEYIAYWRLQDRPSWRHKVLYHYPVDRIPIRNWSTNSEASYLRRLFWGRYFRYRRFMPKRRFLPGLVPYGGPDWWSLSRGCVEHVLRYVRDNPRFARFYRTTASPGEMFFQTIILNSEWAQRVHGRAEYEEWLRTRTEADVDRDTPMLPDELFNFRYVDWSGEIDGRREKPAVLDERDWPALLASPSHFARKFDSLKSAGLLGMIDREILERESPAGEGAAHA